jgi:hypothetical protein
VNIEENENETLEGVSEGVRILYGIAINEIHITNVKKLIRKNPC